MERFGQSSASAARGSALILTVVLTSLLAIVGVLFLMATRIDRMAASAQADDVELSFATDTVLARITEMLAEDVPGMPATPEYHDHPDANDPWLADLEPYRPAFDPNGYYWRQVSNIAGGGIIRANDLQIQLIGERDPIDPNLKADPNLTTADADGDGVGDARWFRVPGITSSKGKPIYAAVRIIDNAGMLNVNTGYEFNRASSNWPDVDGHSQLQVNLMALACRPGDLPTVGDRKALREARANTTVPNVADANDLYAYERQAIWCYDWPEGICTPFDVSDEMELRYRYLLNHKDITTRVENWGRFKPSEVISTPVDSAGDLPTWFTRAAGLLPSFTFDTRYAYRHIATTHSVDRLLMPNRVAVRPGMTPGQMVNVNTADQFSLLQAVTAALSGYNIADPAVIVANLMDYIDDDSTVTPVGGVGGTSQFYGFEQPCIYVSELACRFLLDPATGQIRRSYAVELYKPYAEDGSPGLDSSVGDWKLVIDNPGAEPDVNEPIQWSGTKQFHVLLAEAPHPQASLRTDYVRLLADDGTVDPGASPQSLNAAGFREGATIELQRKVTVGVDDRWLTVDRKVVPTGWMKWSQPDGTARSLQRDIRVEKCIFRLWASPGEVSMPSLGNGVGNYANLSDPRRLQAHPANRPLNNIGELGQVLALSIYGLSDTALSTYQPEQLLIDVAYPAYANLFNYLTVMSPVMHNPSLPDSEMRVKGRININTAPPFVLAQLPWMQYRYNPIALQVEDSPERAVRIVEHRNANGAFRSIADLMQVPAMRELADPCDPRDDLFTDIPPGPDPTPDAVRNDLEERDLIFTRISDLVTVRSDAFTAYILVRIGTDGPQRRVVAILDRSQVMSPGDPVQILGLQQVPDPR